MVKNKLESEADSALDDALGSLQEAIENLEEI